MKKKTLKGLVIGLSIAGTVVAGVSAVSIMTKGFTDYENLKIKPRGEVVERFVWDEDEGRFANENLQDLDESTILEYMNIDREKGIGMQGTRFESTEIGYNASNSVKEKTESLIKYESGNIYGCTYNLFNRTEWSFGDEDLTGQEVGSNDLVYKSVEYDYFNTIRVYFDGIENDLIGAVKYLDEDDEIDVKTVVVKKESSIQESYIDLTLTGGENGVFMLFAKANSEIQEETIKISSIELVNLDTTVEEDATTFFNWGVQAA